MPNIKAIFVASLLILTANGLSATPIIKNNQVKLQIMALEGGATPFEAEANPKEITINKSVPWQKQGDSESDAPTLEFTASDGKTLAFTLQFDTFESKESVHNKYIIPLEKLALVNSDLKRPPMVQVSWGSDFPVFKGVIESISTKYTMFLADGTPIRASIEIKVRETRKAIYQLDRYCHDGEMNNGETGIDCGGNCSKLCLTPVNPNN